MTFLMNNFLSKNSKKFENQINYFLSLRKKNSYVKLIVVRKILREIKKKKDSSLIKYEKKFNKLKKLKSNQLYFSQNEINKSLKNLSKKTKKDIDLAYSRILSFHKNQKINNFSLIDKFKNQLSYRTKPIQSIGVYVPGGKASYPSSVLMNCIPAIVARYPKFYDSSFFKQKNKSSDFVCRKKCKVKKIFKIGGAQAVALSHTALKL